MIAFSAAKYRVSIMKKIIAICLGLGLLFAWYAPAFAQESKEADDPIVLDQKQRAKEREEVDQRYKSTLQKTRKDTPTERVDPWANMRSNDQKK